mgnify:CR=1 FL=1
MVVVAVAIRFGGEVTGALDADGGDPGGILREGADLPLEEIKDAEGEAEDANTDDGPDGDIPHISAAAGTAIGFLGHGGRSGSECEESER